MWYGSASRSRTGSDPFIRSLYTPSQNESQYAIAKVLKAYRAIHVGDLLMPYKSHKTEIPVTDSPPGMEGQIIAGEDHTQMMGDHFVVFIDKGQDDNIMAGQVYSIYYQETVDVTSTPHFSHTTPL